jgi:hypothetical protein
VTDSFPLTGFAPVLLERENFLLWRLVANPREIERSRFDRERELHKAKNFY